MKENILKELEIDKIIYLEDLEKKLNEAKINYQKNEDTMEIYIDNEVIIITYKKGKSNYFKDEIKIIDVEKRKIPQGLPLQKL